MIARQYVKFCLVGGSGLVVDMLVLHLFASPGWLAWNLTLSKVIAAEVAMFNNFLWNDGWTFRGENTRIQIAPSTPERTRGRARHSVRAALERLRLLSQPRRAEDCAPYHVHGKWKAPGNWRSWLVRLAKFNLICTAGIGLSVVLLNLQVSWLSMNVYLANFIAIVLVSFWNFILNRRFGWGTSAARHGATAAGGAHS